MSEEVLSEGTPEVDLIAKESFFGAMITNQDWGSYKWQQKNAVKSIDDLVKWFPGLSEETVARIDSNTRERKLMITPYVASLVERNDRGDGPADADPIWKQLIPEWQADASSLIEYDGETENWELEHEMVTPICQRKYTNRVIIRCSNTCSSYCQFCYEALRTLETKTNKDNFKRDLWQETVEFVQDNPEIEEVILSGGEPLIMENGLLETMLADIRSIPRDICIRIHTRMLTFNPFRVTDSLIDLFEKYGVVAIGLHVVHPNEITPEFKAAVARLQRVVPILFANIPLIGSVNNDLDTMKKLCMGLYGIGVIPHYLYHFMPFSPGVSTYRTSVREGVEILHKMKRHISNMAVPEFVLPHPTGKYTMPIKLAADDSPQWVESDGQPVVKFRNWQGDVVEYSDYSDSASLV